MKNSEDPHKSTKRNHIKSKNTKFYYDDDMLQKKAHKQFKQNKRTLEEQDDDWKNWKDNLNKE